MTPCVNKNRLKIIIDLTALLPVSTGTDVYMRNLVCHLGRIDRINLYRIYINFGAEEIIPDDRPDNFHIVPRSFQNRVARLVFQQIWLPLAAKAWRADVLHSPSFLMPFFRGKQRHMLTVQDTTFFSLPQYHNKLRKNYLFKYMILKSILRTHLLHVPSESTKLDLLQMLPELSPEQIQVIPHGISNEFKTYPKEEIERTVKRLGLPSRYILHVGTIEPRKNLKRLIESYKELSKRGFSDHLVLIGPPGWGCNGFCEEIRNMGLKDKVHFGGYVRQEDLPLVYAGARLFVYPSLYEGFGLPPLEAMACGVPTITSFNSSLGEYYKNAALLVPPEEVNAITNAMDRMLSDDTLRTGYRCRGLELSSKYSWEKTAASILKCYKLLANTKEQKDCLSGRIF